jgi:tRNA(Ile)-lysidine synthase
MPASPIAADEFAAVMDRLGPFEPHPRVAVAVSGGADSMAAAILVDRWARHRGGSVVAFIVDHGLRGESAAEAALVAGRLAALTIPATVLRIDNLHRGPALAERARDIRHSILEAACARRGILHLVFGHHAEDQAETVMMRMLRQSLPAGLSGMAALVETSEVRKLRPCLGMLPERLRATLRDQNLAWVEDPSNTDQAALRPRLRLRRRHSEFSVEATRALCAAAVLRGRMRAEQDLAWQSEIARKVTIFPQGHVILAPGPIDKRALAHLIATIGGGIRPPSLARVEALAASPGPATLGGVRLTAAGKLGPGLLLLREEGAMQAAIPAIPGAIWDGRFRLLSLPIAVEGLQNVTIGAWGRAAPPDRTLPSAVMRTLPVLRGGGNLVAPAWELLRGDAPHVINAPLSPAATAPFFPLPTV